jgi:predicted SAM-dependent methyltransferase
MDRLRQSDAPIRLELGSGPKKGTNGWTTVDLAGHCDLQLDLAEPLPFRDAEVAEIYSSHLLEHFDYRDLVKLLAECHRVLRPEGRFKAVVPDARIYVNGYVREEPFDEALYCTYPPALHYNTRIDYLNMIAYMDGHHRHMFDADNILAVLKRTGFRNVALGKFDPALDLKARHYESIYAVAVK